MVRRDVQTAPADQIHRLHQASYDLSEDHGNWRWVQPGNARPLVVTCRDWAVESQETCGLP